MDKGADWHDLGAAELLAQRPLQELSAGGKKIALSFQNGQFGAISGVCNHVGGPLGQGRLDGELVVCPWHGWKYNCRDGRGEPGYEAESVPCYAVKTESGRVWIDLNSATQRHRLPHPPHSLARPVAEHDGPVRVLGISTTSMSKSNPRYSTSEALLEVALRHAEATGATTQYQRLAQLKFRACEGYYSKSARACTWPCSITQMDPNDQLDRVYEAFVHWADVVLVATPIRWGAASSLYYKMVERMNCIQNQITIGNRVLLRNKVVALIITGGQDGIQAVAGQMLGFFAEVGCVFPQFPYIAHSRGWSAEDMEQNISFVQHSEELRAGAQQLVERTMVMAATLKNFSGTPARIQRGGRKADGLETRAAERDAARDGFAPEPQNAGVEP
jgi:nitrite reductase/ring-hydroxylating ferredoxin subunit/multimeric flavodoxin WrbA